MFYVYVLYSVSFDTIYVGYTNDVLRRLNEHNTSTKTSHTKKYRPWVLLHQENFQTKSEAIDRERQLKSSRGREFIRAIIIKNYN